MLTANQMNEQPLEKRFVPQDQDLGHWYSYLKKTPIDGLRELVQGYRGTKRICF